jgi:solute carrier family 30 (zinc transporter), member 1
MIMGCVGLTLNIISVIFLHGTSCWQLIFEKSKTECSQNTMTTRSHMAILMSLVPIMPVKTTCSRKSVTLHSIVKNSTNKHQTTNPHAEHRHKVDTSKSKGHSHDLGMMAVLMHIAGDAINNIGVIIAAAVIWKANYEGRFYADPAVSMGIAIMITLSGLPVGKPRLSREY